MSNLRIIADRLQDWMFRDSLPMWSVRGINESSRFYETLSFEGKPTGESKSRIRTQARQIFSFALAHELGWSREIAASIVRQTVPVLLQSALRNDGVAGRSIDVDTGQLIDATADLYDTAFCLLALAQSRDIIGQAYADEHIDEFLRNIDCVLRYENDDGYRESLPVPNSRLQNPHMHFFESLLLLYDKTRSKDVWRRSEGLFAYISREFFDSQVGVVREVVTSDAGGYSAGYDPGHSMEWIWLIGHQSRLCDRELPDFACQLYEHALAAQQRHGNTRLYLSDDHEILDGSARLWSQTEALKGHLCVAELGGDQLASRAREEATSCAEYIAESWLTAPVAGGWHDHFDKNGELTATAMPASTGYHLYLAIAELVRVADKLR